MWYARPAIAFPKHLGGTIEWHDLADQLAGHGCMVHNLCRRNQGQQPPNNLQQRCLAMTRCQHSSKVLR